MAMSGPSGGAGGRRRGRGGRRAPMADINVTPLVDVMLVLLIIFMITAPLLASAVPIDLPDSRAAPMEQEPEQIAIAIDADGTIYLDDQPVAPGALADHLAQLFRLNREERRTARGKLQVAKGEAAALRAENEYLKQQLEAARNA